LGEKSGARAPLSGTGSVEVTGLERLWAGWRSEYVGGPSSGDDEPGDRCVLCRVIADGEHVVWRGDVVAVILNAFPYTSGHVLVLPARHVGTPEDLEPEEAAELWRAVTDGVTAIRAAYQPQGLNIGANIGEAAGAGVPGHFHVHALPRWNGDTNFMTSVAEARVMPEALPVTLDKLRAAWPA
jgi:ATP adenylyltransferase